MSVKLVGREEGTYILYFQIPIIQGSLMSKAITQNMFHRMTDDNNNLVVCSYKVIMF